MLCFAETKSSEPVFQRKEAFEAVEIKAIALDLHGVLFFQGEPIPGALEAVNQLCAWRIPLFFVSNSSTFSRQAMVDRLGKYGVACQHAQVLSAGVATIAYLAERQAQEAHIGLIGQQRLKQLLNEAGFQHVFLDFDAVPLDYLIVARDPAFNYDKLTVAWKALSGGATFLATSTDRIVPIVEGYLPGPGPLVSALENASGIEPIVIGKPSPYLFDLLFRETDWKPTDVLVVGDNLETDIVAGRKWGAVTAVVLTGMTNRELAERAQGWQQPDYILPSLAELLSFLKS